MPSSTLSRPLLHRLLGRSLSAEELEQAVFRTKGEVSEVTEETFRFEITSDRLDLLSESGLAFALAGVIGSAEGSDYHPGGAPEPREHPLEVSVDSSVAPLRKEIRMAIVHAPNGKPLDADHLHELIRYQEALHATLGANRARGSLGLYPLAHLAPPFQYAMEGLDGIRFTPLPDEGSTTTEVSGIEFFDRHPMAAAYSPLGRRRGMALTLRDSAGHILSLPPILNAARYGELAVGDSAILIESTGTADVTCRQLVGYMLLPFVARGWRVNPVPVRRRSRVDTGSTVVGVRTLTMTPRQLAEVIGSRLETTEVTHALRRCRFHVTEARGGWTVTVPPWRPDLIGPVDLAEEVVVARGLASLEPVGTPPQTAGHRTPATRYFRKFLEVMVGMGYQEAHTPLLLPPTLSEHFTAAGTALTIANPASQDFSVIRTALTPGLVEALARNASGSYPQRLFEIAEVVVKDPAADTGTRTETHLALVDAGEGSGFARAAAVGEHLARVIGITPVREPADAPGTISGRVAEMRFAGERVAILGEVHPRVLTELGIAEPVSWLELNLSLLWKLKGQD